MPEIVANTSVELLDKLRVTDISVPLRTEGRTSEDCERWSICRFLAAYADADFIRYPLTVLKHERPDFLLSFPGTTVGVEITEAVPPDWARANAIRENLDDDDVIFLQHFDPDEPRRASKEIHKIARGLRHGDGWTGDAPERHWAKVMLHFTKKKAESLTKPGYEPLGTYWLIIYDNWPLPAVETGKASEYFANGLRALEDPFPFERVFVESDRSIWQFCSGARSSRPIPPIWEKG